MYCIHKIEILFLIKVMNHKNDEFNFHSPQLCCAQI